MTLLRRTFESLACVVALLVAGISSTYAVQISSLDLDLLDPNAANDINVFDTVITVEALGQTIVTDPIQVDYVDPNMRGMQVDLDIDFSDPNNPVVNTIEFVGEPGDLEHQFPGGSVNVVDTFFDVTVTPNGVRGFLLSRSGPINVNGDGTFEGGSNSLIARQGTIDVTGTVLGFPFAPISIDLSTTPVEAFTDPISNGSTNTVEVVKTGAVGNTFTYDVTVLANLENTMLSFTVNDVDATLDITGKLLGTGQISVVIPEPATLGLCLLGLVSMAISRSRDS